MKRDISLEWKIRAPGHKFSNGRGTVRELVEVIGEGDYAHKRKVRWKKVEGKGPDEGTVSWASWRKFCQSEWLPPRPARLPLPEVSAVELAFSTNTHAPPLHWVPDEFRDRPGSIYDNQQNPWCKLANNLCLGTYAATDVGLLPRTLPDSEERYNAQQAWNVVMETLRSWGLKHQTKMAICGYMFSEWFEDYWLDSDDRTRVKDAPLITVSEIGEDGVRVEGRVPNYDREEA